MNLLKIVLAVIVAIVALTLFGKIRQKIGENSATSPGAADSKPSDAGFILLKPDEATNPKVVIMSPPNCPSDDAQRARALGDSLARAGIPHEMRQSLQLTFDNPADANRVNSYMMTAPNPLVLVRGRAKGNPTAADVIAEYRAAKP